MNKIPKTNHIKCNDRLSRCRTVHFYPYPTRAVTALARESKDGGSVREHSRFDSQWPWLAVGWVEETGRKSSQVVVGQPITSSSSPNLSLEDIFPLAEIWNSFSMND